MASRFAMGILLSLLAVSGDPGDDTAPRHSATCAAQFDWVASCQFESLRSHLTAALEQHLLHNPATLSVVLCNMSHLDGRLPIRESPWEDSCDNICCAVQHVLPDLVNG